ncbi:DUF6343 family protein [Streptomyces similanensis]|uniref:ATP-binding protein n=1 Tax=Streptomyces similanensis TaxID=1274988 RepID=A0ABP9LLV9_9ACTN|nr:hypothetical protein HUT11_30940 [Streptomyces seoulensis]
MHDAPRSGTEPRHARSPLRLRRLLSGVFLPVFALAAALFAYWATRSGPGDSPGGTVLATLAGVCAALALIAAVDLLVVGRRLHSGRGRTV